MVEHNGIAGELLYEYTVQITQMVEYGVSAEALFSGRMTPPPEGARFDLYFEGPITGPKISGTLRGVDYFNARADGRGQQNIHAEIATADGKKIAFFADGIVITEKGSPVFQLRENVTLTTHHQEYTWLNALQIWVLGTADLSSGQIRAKGYAV